MAKNDAKESAELRKQRIDGSQNGATLRTRIVRDKTKYSRTLKHKKSLADAGDFRYTPLGRAPSLVAINLSIILAPKEPAKINHRPNVSA